MGTIYLQGTFTAPTAGYNGLLGLCALAYSDGGLWGGGDLSVPDGNAVPIPSYTAYLKNGGSGNLLLGAKHWVVDGSSSPSSLVTVAPYEVASGEAFSITLSGQELYVKADTSGTTVTFMLVME